MKLSVAMIVKNEEKNIERTLLALKKIENYISLEIVIVDTGSYDNTVEIAKKYTDKVYSHKWNNDFSSMRNLSIGYCKGEWILIVDADEVLYDVRELVNLFNNKNINNFNAGYIKIFGFYKTVDNSIKEGNVCPMLRLFKNNTIKYSGTIHEQPICKGPLLSTNVRFVHYGYNNDDSQLMEYKFKRNIDLLMKEYANDSENIYIIYQIAVSYNMHKDLANALKYIKIAYEKCKDEIYKYIYVINLYCVILNRRGEYDLLFEKAKEGLKNESFIDFYFYCAESLNNLNRCSEAIEYYKNYLMECRRIESNELDFNGMLIVNTKGCKNTILWNLSYCYYKEGLYEKALENIFKIDDKILLGNKALHIFKIIIDGKCWCKISSLNCLVDKYNYEDILNYLYRDVLYEDILNINENILKGLLKEIIVIIKSLKKDQEIHKDLIKDIISDNKVLYEVYTYYLLKNDINEIKELLLYGNEKIQNVLINLCKKYYDFNAVLIKEKENFTQTEFEDIEVKAMFEKALLLGGNLSEDLKQKIFLDFIAHRYYVINKIYDITFIDKRKWMLSEEDNFVIQVKEALSYKYKDISQYIKGIKQGLDLNKLYASYLKLLLNDIEDPISREIKELIPGLCENINDLLNKELYQEAYDTTEEGLKLVKFDLDLMTIKYKLLVKFNYEKEAGECLKEIILFGYSEKVNKLILEI
ncbi:glycosyltransferase [Haloimpatiens sp. FM7315]|uniref:glycosyltransferase n=1 Tax=Haloimpatiens sp. FM7315 TaxID=3298609 RepID=UPI00370BADE4